ncbi:MAG: HlyD family secretion protein [Gammaproteobacteria bacterium]|nr:HlyD family secretion protein [Gammaproteobacteria bacterium]
MNTPAADPDAEENRTGAQQESAAGQEAGAPTSVKRGGLSVAVLILVSLVWYLLADRFTPYTDQARVQGYVVGVAPQVSGIVREVWVKNNQPVAEGDRLFQIDPLQYEIALAKAQSDLENTQRQVEAGDAAVAAARANLRSALANLEKAEKDTARLERLREEDPGTISTRRLEVSRANLDQARSGVAAAESGIQQAIEQKGGDGENNSLLKIARTSVEKAQLDLQRTTVVASSRGVITDLRADVGVYAGAGAPLMTLVAVNDVWVRAEFTENNLGRIKIGTPVDILFDVAPGRIYPGKISSIGLGISASQPPPPGTLPSINNSRDWLRQSQRFPVDVSFELSRDDPLMQQLRIGAQASVVAYGDGAGPLAWLGKVYIRIMSWLSYAY